MALTEEYEMALIVSARSVTGEKLEGISYTLTMPNGEVKSGTLDATQTIRVEGIRDPGECKIELKPDEEMEPVEE